MSCPRCGAAVDEGRPCALCLLDSRLPPLLLADKLELFEPLGEGGMGTVFRARHLHLERIVAVKLLPEHRDSAENRARFEREGRALARLDHPGIVTVFDFGLDGDQPYLVMEHVPGGSLRDHLPLDVAAALTLGLELTEALRYAHEQGLVHRDIKPDNVLLDEEGRAKLTDFGIARSLEQGWTLTTPDMAWGSPHFLAPEVLRGATPDPRMDIYSLGILLYQAVSGHLPMGAFQDLPGELGAVVRKAMAPEPADRWQSAAAMQRALADIANSQAPAGDSASRSAPVAPPPPSPASGDPSLPADETGRIRAVALVLTVATAAVFWAGLLCLTPKVVDEQDPLTMFAVRELPDGRLVSMARFETGAILGAVAAIALALLVYSSLRRHWRKEGLELRRPDEPLRLSRWIFGIGAFQVAGYVTRRTLRDFAGWSAASYLPVAGGLTELVAVYLVWLCVLDALRRGRSLTREPLFWAGIWLSLVPPTFEFIDYVRNWTP